MTEGCSKNIRVLHLVRTMGHGGIQARLVDQVRELQDNGFDIDVLTHFDPPGELAAGVVEHGGRVMQGCHPRSPLRHLKFTGNLLRENGPYDVVHGHHSGLWGPVMRLAARAGVPVRIVHCHGDVVRARPALPERLYCWFGRQLSRRYATHAIAVSEHLAAPFWGRNWQQDKRFAVIPQGYCFADFAAAVPAASVRADVGIPENSRVVGHVGGFAPQKNHAFILDIAARLAAEPDIWFLFVGDGELRPAIEREFRRLPGVGERAVFAGCRDDVPRLMLGAMDCFVFPSLSEGLGGVVLEAQAAGLPTIAATTVPAVTTVVPELVTRLELAAGGDAWADAVRQHLSGPPPVPRGVALDRLKASPFDISRHIKALKAIYSGEA